MNVLLLCASGLSTSLLVNNMRQYAKKNETIYACSTSELSKFLEGIDVILVGPQVRYLLETIEKTVSPTGQVVALMDTSAYRHIDGFLLLQQARDVFKKKI